ncbi:MAG TPA: hypothetical protein VGO58_07820 [Chitinophagaceae bacterium]|jgi:hypothetical protein|nr:hypothetical protein [Chitinophagaceae bacterium]
MEDEFNLPVVFEDKALLFPARLLNYGYSSKLEVDVNGTRVLFEPDEERNWRALVSFEGLQANKKLDAGLLKAIAEAIEKLTK